MLLELLDVLRDLLSKMLDKLREAQEEMLDVLVILLLKFPKLEITIDMHGAIEIITLKKTT
jgi:hypothetical protein